MKKVLIPLFTLMYLVNSVFGQDFREKIEEIRIKHDIMGGVVVIFDKDKVLETIPFGTADLDRSIVVTDSTVFRIASISKTITTLAIMQLTERKMLSLDQDISDILGYEFRNPYFPRTPITIRMLLSHTSSLDEGDAYDNFLGLSYNGNPVPDIGELINKDGKYFTRDLFLNKKPGTFFSYSNLGYGIAGTVVEKISGKRFDVYCRENIFLPLKIDASYNVLDFENMDKLSVLYRKQEGIWTPQADNYSGIKPDFENLKTYIPGTNGLRSGPQGGVRISGKDLAKIFMIFLNDGEVNGTGIVQKKSIKKMLNDEWNYNGKNSNHKDGFFRSWGLGMQRITKNPKTEKILRNSAFMAGHPGGAYGLISNAYIDPGRKTGFVMIINGCGSGYGHAPNSTYMPFERDFFELVERYLSGK